MGDAARQLPYRLHFLPVAQGFLGTGPLLYLELQLHIGLGQCPGTLGHTLLKGFVKLKQSLFGGAGLQALVAP